MLEWKHMYGFDKDCDGYRVWAAYDRYAPESRRCIYVFVPLAEPDPRVYAQRQHEEKLDTLGELE